MNDPTKTGFDFNVYPNPLSNKGSISYILSAPATVSASISDIMGKEIAVLKNEKEQTGSYSIDIPNVKTMSAGMYFATVTVNGEAHTKKFIIQ